MYEDLYFIYHVIFVGNECCERLAYYGMSSNLVRYFKYHLNEHSATASRNLSTWVGTCYLTPLIGAFVADTYLGRYWTITTFSIIYATVSIIFCMCILQYTISLVEVQYMVLGHGNVNVIGIGPWSKTNML